jgi:hypothetical protein
MRNELQKQKHIFGLYLICDLKVIVEFQLADIWFHSRQSLLPELWIRPEFCQARRREGFECWAILVAEFLQSKYRLYGLSFVYFFPG